MAEIITETARLILRTQVPGDILAWAEHMNTPAVTDHLGGPRNMQKIEASFAKNNDALARNGFAFMMIEHKETGDFLGNVGLKYVDSEFAPAAIHGEFEIGWSVRGDYWRQGYAFEAASATLALAFERYGADRVFAFTTDRNIPSWRLMEKLQMVRRAEFDFDDPDYVARDNPTIVYQKGKPS
jgi:RimJ/RimL family protein N-acetyltransferase